MPSTKLLPSAVIQRWVFRNGRRRRRCRKIFWNLSSLVMAGLECEGKYSVGIGWCFCKVGSIKFWHRKPRTKMHHIFYCFNPLSRDGQKHFSLSLCVCLRMLVCFLACEHLHPRSLAFVCGCPPLRLNSSFACLSAIFSCLGEPHQITTPNWNH